MNTTITVLFELNYDYFLHWQLGASLVLTNREQTGGNAVLGILALVEHSHYLRKYEKYCALKGL